MQSAEGTRLFSVAQAAKAAGISRSTLLRLEERGLLRPAAVTEGSGRRLYDTHNIARVVQIKGLLEMGFSYQEAAQYYASQGDARELLASLEARLDLLRQQVEEMRLRARGEKQLSVELVQQPRLVCCARRGHGSSPRARYESMYAFYGDCVAKGRRLAPQPLFTVTESEAPFEGQLPAADASFLVCVPVLPRGDEEDLLVLEPCTALSVLYYGDYSGINEAWALLAQEAKRRGLVPAGYVRVMGVVGPYTGREIPAQWYCSRLLLPVRTDRDGSG